MNTKFKELYQNWYNKNSFLAYCTFENDPDWKKLEEWSLQNKKEAVLSIKEQIEKEPCDTVMILDKIFDNPIVCDGFIPLDKYCEIWLKILNDYEKEGGFNGNDSQTEND